jgi:hypothetical protein
MNENLEEKFVRDFESTAPDAIAEMHKPTLHIMGSMTLGRLQAESAETPKTIQ